MTSNVAKPDATIKMYQSCMKDIQFMHQYLEETEIFNPHSIELRNFLIQSFAHLNPEFHYLSFVNNECIDQELLKVSGILQILPSSICKKDAKLFGTMNESDVHRFWLRFFSLFKTNENEKFTVDETFGENKAKFDFFSSMENTLQYLNYTFPVVSSKKLKNVNLEHEIETWSELNFSNLPANESTDYECDIEQVNDINLEKLILDLKRIAKMYNRVVESKIEKEIEYKEFFIKFIDEAKNALNYKRDFSTIDSNILQDNSHHLLLKNDDWSTNVYFIKKCINSIKFIKSKIV